MTLTDPFFGWGTLALTTAEMMMASAIVIPHRTRRKNSPAQLFEMGNEKVQAAMEASHAMTRHWMRMGSQPSAHAWAELLSSGVAPFHRRAVGNARRAKRR
jgi:hypothetical protein